jgi:hypothetical protein
MQRSAEDTRETQFNWGTVLYLDGRFGPAVAVICYLVVKHNAANTKNRDSRSKGPS